jgi:hypothetical protein
MLKFEEEVITYRSREIMRIKATGAFTAEADRKFYGDITPLLRQPMARHIICFQGLAEGNMAVLAEKLRYLCESYFTQTGHKLMICGLNAELSKAVELYTCLPNMILVYPNLDVATKQAGLEPSQPRASATNQEKKDFVLSIICNSDTRNWIEGELECGHEVTLVIQPYGKAVPESERSHLSAA